MLNEREKKNSKGEEIFIKQNKKINNNKKNK